MWGRGATLGGLLAVWLLTHFGWRSVFQFGGDLYPMLGIVAVFMVGQALEGTVLTPLLVLFLARRLARN